MILGFIKEYFITGIILFFMIGIRFSYDSYMNQVLPNKNLMSYGILIFTWPFYFLADSFNAVRKFLNL